MYLSRVTLDLSKLMPEMMQKWQSATPYACHQWLWQLFAHQDERYFLFRHEPARGGECFYVQSEIPPQAAHNLFTVESKPFQPQLTKGMFLRFSLRANPVITRAGKRSDVMMDAKYQANKSGIPAEQHWSLQIDAANDWLRRQGEQHGFTLPDGQNCVVSYQQQSFSRRTGERPVCFGSVDFEGLLQVDDVARFTDALRQGLGKSKALGCGLMLIRRG
jgi:CRISPR system Cascade subunit CasE